MQNDIESESGVITTFFQSIVNMALIVSIIVVAAMIYSVVQGVYVKHQPWMDTAIQPLPWMQTATSDVNQKSIGKDTRGNFYLTIRGCTDAGYIIKPECVASAIQLPIFDSPK